MNKKLQVAQRSRWTLLGLSALALGCQGCSQLGYNLGSMLPPDISSVHVPLVDNRTDEPDIESDVTTAVIDFIQRDGSLSIASEADADAVLHVIVQRYEIVPIAFESERRTAAEEYRIYLTASIALIRQADGEVIAESPGVRGESTFELAGDMTSSKLVGLPDAAEDLAHDIVEKIVEYW